MPSIVGGVHAHHRLAGLEDLDERHRRVGPELAQPLHRLHAAVGVVASEVLPEQGDRVVAVVRHQRAQRLALRREVARARLVDQLLDRLGVGGLRERGRPRADEDLVARRP